MSSDAKTPKRRAISHRVVTSPQVHFFAIGGLIFAAYALLDDRPDPNPDVIALSEEQALLLADRFESRWNRRPTVEEMDQMMQSWAVEEASVREALALGLDQNDAVIRQRLNVKMRFLAELQAATLIPDRAELQAYLDQNPARFETPPRLAFRQIFTPSASDERIVQIAASLNAGANPVDLGEASLLPRTVPASSAPAIDAIFGSGFSAALQALPDGEWAGPVNSSYGPHLVMITERSTGGLPPLDQIRDRVEAEWRATKAQEIREAFGQDLRDRYQVVLPPAAQVVAK